MKTFEESLTAWIDDRLEGEECVAFERTLATRPDAEEFHREKRGASRLRVLLREHLPAMTPALGQNADFFSHQLRERIQSDARAAEVALAARPARPWWATWLGGSRRGTAAPARLLAAGAACLVLAAAGIYTLLPARGPASGANNPPAVAEVSPNPGSANPTPAQQRRPDPVANVASNTSATPSPNAVAAHPPGVVEADGSIRMASADSSRKNDPQLTDIVTARVPEGTATSATAVHFDDQNADVLWLDGLEYQPDPPAPGAAAPAGGAENPAPAAPTPVPAANEKQP